jgi:hypothetical protein
MKIVLSTHFSCFTNTRCAVEFVSTRKPIKKVPTSDSQTLGIGRNFEVRICQLRIRTQDDID